MAALKRIDANKKGFVIIVDKFFKILGVLTDGDIRRGLIAGKNLENTIWDFCTKNPQSVEVSASMIEVTEIFRSEKIKFLPITDSEGRLVNIITKAQMHVLLLQDIHADLLYDFMSLNENIIDHEIHQRPWGFYKTTVLNDYYQSKVLSLKPGGKLSLQAHNYREEYWIVVHGRGEVQLDDSIIYVACGHTVFIPKGAKHSLINRDERESLIISEVQIGAYFGEDDIIRYEDIYGRV